MLNSIYTLRFPLLVFALIACFFLWPGVKTAINVDNSLTVWFLDDDPALVAYNDFQEKFGNDELIILMIKDSDSLLQTFHFQRFVSMTNELQKLDAVERVTGPGNAQVTLKGMFAATTRPLISEKSTPEYVYNLLKNHEVLKKQLFTDDYKAARFIIELKAIPDFDSKRGEILEDVKLAVHQFYDDEQTHFGGVGVIYAGLNKLSQRDFAFFIVIGYVMMFVLMLIIYRRFSLMLYALGTISLATYITIGLYGLLGHQINLMTILLPVVIILLGMMDVIHVINEKHQPKYMDMDKKKSAIKALKKVYKPCLFTTLTTMAGFLALTISPMAILKNFGIFSAIGIMLSMVFTYLLGVIILPVSRPSDNAIKLTSSGLSKLLKVVHSYKAPLMVLSATFILCASFGISFLKTDTDTLGYFPKKHEVVQDHEAIQNTWGAYFPLELLVIPKKDFELHDPEIVKQAFLFEQNAVQNIEGLGEVFGFHSLYKAGTLSSDHTLGRSELWQAARQLESRYPVLSKQYVNSEENIGRITVYGNMMSAATLSDKMSELLLEIDGTLANVADVKPAGYQPMYASIVSYVTHSQINSLLLAFLLIFVLVFTFIRDLRLAILSITPNFFPIIVMLGIMGWAGIHLDIATASIAAIVLSFCIDDTIHFIYTYQRYRKKGQTLYEARKSTIMHVGSAIVLTSLILFFGYAIMIFASLQTVMLFGLLTSITIIGALYSHLVIFPVLLERFDKRD